MKKILICLSFYVLSLVAVKADIYRAIQGESTTLDAKSGICTYHDTGMDDFGTYIMSTVYTGKYVDVNFGQVIPFKDPERGRPFFGISTTYFNDLMSLPKWIQLEIGVYIPMTPNFDSQDIPYGIQLGLINLEW